MGLNQTFSNINKYGWFLQWPKKWIALLGIIQIFLALVIAGMEVGHTIVDLYRSTAFGGFILFIPLLICAIFVLITVCKSRLVFLRIALVFCCVLIVLCCVLIAYDILIDIDPTRCFILSCSNAVIQVDSTSSVTGWPVSVTWPSAFQTTMNYKRIFMSIQLLCAGLFILTCFIYIVIYLTYRNINSSNKADSDDSPRRQNYVTTKPAKNDMKKNPSSPFNNTYQKGQIQTYMIQNQVSSYQHQSPSHRSHDSSPIRYARPQSVPITNKRKQVYRVQPTSDYSYNRLCTRCQREPKIGNAGPRNKNNYFTNLCLKCNDEIKYYREQPIIFDKDNNRVWRP